MKKDFNNYHNNFNCRLIYLFYTNAIKCLKAKEYKVENYYIISKKDEIKTIGIYNSDNNNYKTQQKI